MNPLLFQLPVDWSGTNIHNRTKAELHDLSPQSGDQYRIIVMEKGYFWNANLYMIDSKGYVLKSTDYKLTMPNPELQKKTGRAACAVIVITNETVSNKVYVDAQMVGGIYCNVSPAVVAQANALLNSDGRTLFWRNITGKPDTYLGNGHFHALWQLYGFTPQTAILKRMSTALDTSTGKAFDDLYAGFEESLAAIAAQKATTDTLLAAHIANQNNPHQLTALQVTLNYVYNGAPATNEQAQRQTGALLTAYATPYTTALSIATNFTPNLQQHITDYNNPHKLTTVQLGTLTTSQINSFASGYVDRGTWVNSSNRLSGVLYASIYAQARTNIPPYQIKTGILPFSTTANGTYKQPSVLSPTYADYLSWLNIQVDPTISAANGILYVYTKKTNKILYVSGQVGGPGFNDSNMADMNTQLTQWMGTNYANGTIAVYRWITDWVIGTGNGSYTTRLTSLGMAVMMNGVWTVPGYHA